MRHPLYTAALDADARYTATIAELFPGRTRWTLTREQNAHPRIHSAYLHKAESDREWLHAMRECGA